ncbi:MAG TPA: cytochrome c oxidase assembly factor Coa1 family protein [Thermoanaerobaculia bacterium]|jgi:hypothetical protein
MDESSARVWSALVRSVRWKILRYVSLFGVLVLICLVIHEVLKASRPYEMAVETLRTDRRIEAVFGHPIRVGWLVQGSVTTHKAGGGEASLRFSLSGPKDRGSAQVSARRTESIWRLTELTVQATEAKQSWDLVAQP